MAFSFENQSGKNVFGIAGVVIIVILLGVGTYLLFFSKAPLAEVIAPPGLEDISNLSAVKIEDGTLANNPVYKMLGPKVNEIELGTPGRENPFARF
jgi:hypothetical protein